MSTDLASIRAERRGPALHDIRDRLLRAARVHFSRYGYGKTTVSDLATAIGFSKAYIYKFFASKQAIGDTVSAQILGELVETIRTDIDRADSPTDRLRRFIHSCAQANGTLYLEERRLYEILGVAASERWHCWGTYEIAISEMLQLNLDQGRASREFERKTPIDEVSTAILRAIRPIMHPMMLPYGIEDHSQATNQITDLVLRSLAP